MNVSTTPAELAAVARLRAGLRRFAAATEAATLRHQLTLGWYDLLALLHSSETRSRTASELATELSLGRSSVTDLVTRAQNAGLVERESDQRDNRVKHIRPTAEGTSRYLAATADLRTESARLVGMLEAMTAEAAVLTDGAKRKDAPRSRRRQP